MSRVIDPSPPAGPRTPQPPRNPAPIPQRPVPPPPQPRPGRVLTLRLAVAFIAVGVLILVFRYFAPVILLAALPTKQWRAAANGPQDRAGHGGARQGQVGPGMARLGMAWHGSERTPAPVHKGPGPATTRSFA